MGKTHRRQPQEDLKRQRSEGISEKDQIERELDEQHEDLMEFLEDEKRMAEEDLEDYEAATRSRW